VTRGFECTFLELDVIGDALELDLRLFPFQFPVHGEFVAERVRLLEAAHGTLTAKGLIEGPRFAPDVEDLLGLFARGTVAVAVLGSADGEGICARAVADQRFGVVAVQHGQAITFDPVTPASLVRATLALLPPMRPGPGSSVMVTADQPVAAGRHRVREDDMSEHQYLQSGRSGQASSGSRQAAVVDEIMRRPRLGSGYLTVTSRNRNGRESEPLTMSWLDTDAGRYAVLPSLGPDGRTHITYTPADLARLDQALTHLVAQAT
jgi:ESX secretion-associated protein EspG